MQALLMWIGRLAGIAGIVVVGVAVAGRLDGIYRLGGFQIGTILQAGMAAILIACLGYVAAIAERGPR